MLFKTWPMKFWAEAATHNRWTWCQNRLSYSKESMSPKNLKAGRIILGTQKRIRGVDNAVTALFFKTATISV